MINIKAIITLLLLSKYIIADCPNNQIKVLCENSNEYICCNEPEKDTHLYCDKRIAPGCLLMKEPLNSNDCHGQMVPCPILFRASPMEICCEKIIGYNIHCQSLMCLYSKSTVNNKLYYLN